MPGRPVNWCINLFNNGFQYPNSLPGPYWDVQFFWGHSQFSTDLKDEIMATCSHEELMGITSPPSWSPACTHLVTVRLADEVGYFFAYNLFEACPDEVTDEISGAQDGAGFGPRRLGEINGAQDGAAPAADAGAASAHAPPARTHRQPPRRRHRRLAHRRLSQPTHAAGRVSAMVEEQGGRPNGGPYSRHRAHDDASEVAGPTFQSYGDGDSGLGAACLVDSMEVYFRSNATLTALGIPLDNNFIVLDNGIGMNYTTDAPFVGPVYERALKAGLRVLVYEGDSDASGLQTLPMYDVWVPFFGNGSGVWTPAGRLNASDPAARPLGLPLTQPWRPFGVLPAGRKVQGGYVMEWADGQATFVSIKGAGHLAPTYRPSAAYTMMEAFIGNKPLPPRIK